MNTLPNNTEQSPPKPKPQPFRVEVEGRPFPLYPLHRVVPRGYQRKHRPRDHLYASELMACQRAVWFNWRHPQPHDASFEQHRGALGMPGETMAAKQLRKILVAEEVSFTDKKVSGGGFRGGVERRAGARRVENDLPILQGHCRTPPFPPDAASLVYAADAGPLGSARVSQSWELGQGGPRGSLGGATRSDKTVRRYGGVFTAYGRWCTNRRNRRASMRTTRAVVGGAPIH